MHENTQKISEFVAKYNRNKFVFELIFLNLKRDLKNVF